MIYKLKHALNRDVSGKKYLYLYITPLYWLKNYRNVKTWKCPLWEKHPSRLCIRGTHLSIPPDYETFNYAHFNTYIQFHKHINTNNRFLMMLLTTEHFVRFLNFWILNWFRKWNYCMLLEKYMNVFWGFWYLSFNL